MSAAESGGDGHRELSREMADQILEGGQLGFEIREGTHEAGGPRPTVQPHEVLELHVCMGLNACKNHDVEGKAPLPGAGSCATVQHVCHGDNECRGQGGCGYLGREYEQSIPGEQACSENGSCASPINECRVASAGPFKGTGVWKLARKRFEERMWQAGRPFQPAPGEGYPDYLVPGYEKRQELMESTDAVWEGLVHQAEQSEWAQVSGLPEYLGGA